MKIYHNPRCSKSRKTLQLIKDAGIEPEIIEYLNTPPTGEELDNILRMLRMEPEDLIRKGEPIFREIIKGKDDFTREETIQMMVENPKLIERPIVVKGSKAVIGRPPENVNELL